MAELVDVFQKELRKDPISTTLVDIHEAAACGSDTEKGKKTR